MHRLVVRRAAHVAADAFADLIRPAFADFQRQERISNRGPRRTDEILHPTPDLRHHGFGRGEPPHRHHWLRRQAFHETDVRFLKPLGTEPRRFAVIAQRARNIHIPQVRQFGEHLDHLAPLAVAGDAARPVQFIHRQPQGDGTGVTHRVLGILDHLAQQPGAVFQRPAIGIATGVAAA